MVTCLALNMKPVEKHFIFAILLSATNDVEFQKCSTSTP